MPSYANLNIYQLILDLENPRIKKYLEIYKQPPTDSNIYIALGAGTPEEGQSSTTFYSLRESIRMNQGIIHPIIVNKNKKGEHLVIEGNTRVAIYREFDEKKVDGNWKLIPAIIFENLKSHEIDAIRLQAHLVGPREWDPYSKAKYLNYLRQSKHITMNEIISYCGGRQKEIENYIEAYNDMETYYRPILDSDSEFDQKKFSAFVELQKPGIKQKILSAGFTLKNFSSWVNDELIYPLSTVRQLPEILTNPTAKAMFLKDGAREAIKLLGTEATKKLEEAGIEDLAAVLYKKLSSLPLDEFKEMKKDLSKKKVVTLFSLEEELVDTCKMIRDEN